MKVTIQFRGREQSRPEMGYRLLQKLAEELAEVSVVEFAPKQEGRNMTMVLGPAKKTGSVKKLDQALKQNRFFKQQEVEYAKDENP